MMCSESGESDQRPIHEVGLRSFRMAESEVTVGQYRKCVEAGVCTEPGTRGMCTWVKSGHEDHPINYVDWGQTRNFSHWAAIYRQRPSWSSARG